MGIFDRFKKVKNFITGGGVQIVIEFLDECYLRKPFRVNVRIIVEDQEIDAEIIYLEIKFTEKVEVQNSTYDSRGQREIETVRKSDVLYHDQIILEESVVLSPNQIFEFETLVELPLEGMPAFTGSYSQLIWTMQAFIEKSGNDPNSQLVEFEPLYEII